MSTYKAIIFDLDGVICSTDQYHYRAWKKMADEIEVYSDETINNRLRGVSRMESLDIILEKSEKSFTAEGKEQLAEKKNNIYKNLLQAMSTADLSDEVKTTLDGLRSRGLLLAIDSSSKNTKMILHQLGLEGYFDAVSDGTKITRSKPDPEVFLCAADMLHLSPADCMVVEDASAGIEAAAAGGFDSVGIGEAAEHRSVTYPIRSFCELTDVIDECTR